MYLKVWFQRSCVPHPQLEWPISWFCSDKDMLYIILTNFSCWFQPCDYQNDPMATIRGQPVLGYRRPSPLTCISSNNKGFEPFVTSRKGEEGSTLCALRQGDLHIWRPLFPWFFADSKLKEISKNLNNNIKTSSKVMLILKISKVWLKN